MPLDATTLGTGAAAFLCAAWGVIQTHRMGKAQSKADAATGVSTTDLARSNAELAEAYKGKAAEWKLAFEQEHAESVAYRDYIHEKAKVDNAALLKLTEENAILRARTDLTPLIDHMETQSLTNGRVAAMLEKLTTAIGVLMTRIGIAEVVENTNPKTP